MHRKNLINKQKIVLKIGSSSLTHSNGRLNLMRVEKLVRVIADRSAASAVSAAVMSRTMTSTRSPLERAHR